MAYGYAKKKPLCSEAQVIHARHRAVLGQGLQILWIHVEPLSSHVRMLHHSEDCAQGLELAPLAQ